MRAQMQQIVDDAPPPLAGQEDMLAGDRFENPFEGGTGGSSAPAPTHFTDSEIEVLQSLAQRRTNLERRERQLAQREALLSAAEVEVDRKISELNQLRSEIEELLGKQSTEQENRLRSLVRIYENMKPQEAARIMNTLDMDVLLDVIARMPERRSAPIMANMNPERARQITIRLAERSRLPQVAEE